MHLIKIKLTKFNKETKKMKIYWPQKFLGNRKNNNSEAITKTTKLQFKCNQAAFATVQRFKHYNGVIINIKVIFKHEIIKRNTNNKLHFKYINIFNLTKKKN